MTRFFQDGQITKYQIANAAGGWTTLSVGKNSFEAYANFQNRQVKPVLAAKKQKQPA